MRHSIFILVLFALFLQACGSGASTPQEETPTQAPATQPAPTDVPTQEPIVHTTIPAGGLRPRAYAHDHEQSATPENKNVQRGDDFRKNQFERPFTANEMAYLPHLDIVDFGITSDDQFFYISVILTGLNPETQTLDGVYGVEIDRDADGRAELMLAALPPYATEFSAENVVVLADLDGDIGGTTATRPDQDFEGNGYDGIIFDLGQGIHPTDPDLAWARLVEGERPSIEIAYRKWIFRGGDEKFMWSVFAFDGQQGLDPAKFYLHDTLSEIEAGSPDKGNPNYPLKALAALDNTCRVPLGFDAVGNEPLGCLVGGPEKEAPVEEEGGGENGAGENGSGAFCSRFAEVCNRQPPSKRPPGFFLIPAK
ncbi:MAG: hypothetical protein ACOYYJ_07685 [Chloroflexota bacterium]